MYAPIICFLLSDPFHNLPLRTMFLRLFCQWLSFRFRCWEALSRDEVRGRDELGHLFPSPEPLRSNGDPGGGCLTSLDPGPAQQPCLDPSCHWETPALVLLTPPDAVSPLVLVLRAAAVDFRNANLSSDYSNIYVTGSLYCIPFFERPPVGYFSD